LRRKFPVEISKYGDEKYHAILKDCSDRRFLFSLINGELTFDQFVVRVNCDTKKVEYSCKDDMIRKHKVSLHYFEEDRCTRKEKELKAIHGVRHMDQITPDQILGNEVEKDATNRFLALNRATLTNH